MKQTNNAIKFLMAQYRAIFKNANIAMVAAMVAAALAAGQAQADPGDRFDPTVQKTNGEITTEIALGAKGSIYLDAGGKDKININNGGNLKLDTNSTEHFFTDTDLVVNSGGKISLVGDSNTKDPVPGLVGAAKDVQGATQSVPVASLTVNADATVTVTSSHILMKNVTFNGGTIEAGGKTGRNNSEQAWLNYSNIYADGGKLTVAGEATVNLKDASGLYGDTVEINGGTINMSGSTAAGLKGESGAFIRAGSSTVSGVLTMTAGNVNVATGKSGAMVGDTINITGGKVNVAKDANLVIGSNFHATAPDAAINVAGNETVNVVSGGVLTLDGNATFASKSLKVVSGSKIDLGTLAAGDATRTLTVDSADIKAMLESGDALVGTGEATNEFILKLTDTEADLSTSTIVQDTGVISDGIAITTAKLTVAGGDAKFLKGEFSGATAFDFNNLTVGDSNEFALKDAAKVTVHNALNVSGDAAQTALNVTSGTLVLESANADASGSVSAKTIKLEGTNAADAVINVNKGKWGVTDLTLTKGNAVVSGGSTLNVGGNLTLTEGTFDVKDNSTLKVAGNLSTAGATGKLVADSSVVDTISGGSVTLAAQGLELKNTAELKLESKDFHKSTSDNTFDVSKVTTGSIAGDTTSVVSFDNGALQLSKTDFDKLVTQLGDTYKGTIKVELTGVDPLGPDATLDDVANKAATDIYESAAVKHDSTQVVTNTNKSVGSITLTGGTELQMGKDSALTLNTAKDGKLVAATSSDQTIAGDVKFTAAGSTIVLAGNGEVGNIKNTHTANAGLVTVGKADKAVSVTVTGSIGESAANKGIETLIVNKGSSLDVTGNVYTTNLDLRANTSLVAGDGSGDVVVADAAEIMGDLTAGTLSFGAASEIAGEAFVDVKTLNAGAQTLTVGNADAGATIVADTFVLNGGKLFVDPGYGKPATQIVVGNISDQADKTDAKLNGDFLIGQNSVVSIGYTQAEFDDVMADYLVQNGGFSDQLDGHVKNGVKNALLLNKQIEVADGKGIVIDPEGTTNPNTLGTSLKGNTLVMKAGSALIISDEAFGADKKEAAIKFLGTTTNAGTVTAATGSKVVLVGDFDANDTALKIAVKNDNAAATGVDGLSVEYAGGLLKGTYDAQAGGFKLEFQQDKADAIYDGVSRPVADAIVAKLKGEFKDKSAAGYGLLSDLIAAGNYKAIDAAAHAATYAGAQQAAVAAVTTMADAMFGRVGAVGVEAASIAATGSQANGGVWLTPMYKSVDADGFNAEGASYGADVDLSGVAFGADTVNGNMRFGAVFNIGSGDADGKGNGNGLKDEFDYYGFGIYSAMGFGNFALVGDASLTVISHEVEGLGLRGKADTTAVTMGVTGQYTVSTPMVDVTPHLGARFIRLDTDSYDLISANGVEATTDFDVQNVFSVPLGVTLSKAFVAGGWSLAPSADLTVAFNTGDTEAKSNTFIAGKNIGLNTEVLDEVTYGVTLGLGAQYGAFGTSFGINYTGSENTDSFGVNAQARYMF